MNGLGQPERATQNRVLQLFQNELGYQYLGNWQDRSGNSNIEEVSLTAYLRQAGYAVVPISRAIDRLRAEATHHDRGLYANNQAVYQLLRYGVNIKTGPGAPTQTIWLIDWRNPEKNHFAIAEEVTLRGGHERRPDLVLYVNGIALAVLELKNSRVSVGDGIRQCISNQRAEFNEAFFSTVQFLFAGNDSEGLRYGSIKTEEKYFLQWKEDEADGSRFKLDKYLLKLCQKARFLELIHDFILFDGGVKKLPRVHQYFGIKAAQEHVRQRKGGIIWHTQGSGKSIVMVLLAKWILETNPRARVAIITDRTELDKQIKDVFGAAGETVYRTSSGRDLLAQLAQPAPRLLCSLVHKFGLRAGNQFERMVSEIENQPCQTSGELFVFVDECHRTESGRLHRAMKAVLKNAVFIGFTGTPLLKDDKLTSQQVFGSYIHTYKFHEAVEDKVVLDLVYEARDIDQRIKSRERIDEWFDLKTKNLNDWQKAALREHWGTLQRVLGSASRREQIVADIVFDFERLPRLNNHRGNALLVAHSIYDACRYYLAFQKTELQGKCAVVTSYNPQASDITVEDTGAASPSDAVFLHHNYVEILDGRSTEQYEDWAKALFVKEPANMKLLIVVAKLLTGFDAPPCTYLYLDKSMQDHGLFQAICRTNRLDGEDKEFGYIVDYKDLFRKVEKAIKVYTSELDQPEGVSDPGIFMQERLTALRKRLDDSLEAVAVICEPVPPPGGELEHIHYFCGNTENAADLAEREPRRVALYKAIAGVVRAYASLVDSLEAAGYTPAEIIRLQRDVALYVKLRDTIRQASGETLDLKPYEAGMRQLIDTYIEADAPRKISPFDHLSLLELIVKTGIADAINGLPEGIRGNQDAVAETIENNVRRKIVKDQLTDPAFYARMSALLDEIIAERRARALAYEEYLKKIAALVQQVQSGQAGDTPPALDTPGRRALFNSLGQDESLALKVDRAVKAVRADAWRGVPARERDVKRALYQVLGDAAEVERIFLIIAQQPEY